MNARVLGSFLTVALALSVPGLAHAGFGRRGSASSSGGHSSSGGSGRSSASRSNVHVDSGSGSHRYEPSRESRSAWSSGSRSDWSGSRSGWGGPRRRPWGPGYHVWGYSFGYWPPPPVAAPVIVGTVDAPGPAYGTYEDAGPPAVATSLAGDLMFGVHGFTLGGQLAWEGERLGFNLGYTAAFAPIAGTPDYDTIHLAQAHLTYALLAGERGRLRAEFGPHLAVAPEVTFIAPGFGLSGIVALVGPLGFEARVFGNIWPYTQVDARAGFALSAGSVGVSFGLRGVYLNDHGVLGALNAGDNSDSFYGPYVNLGVAL